MKHLYKANRKDIEELSNMLTDGMEIEVSAETHPYVDGRKWYDCYFVYIDWEETRFTKRLVDELIAHDCITKCDRRVFEN